MGPNPVPQRAAISAQPLPGGPGSRRAALPHAWRCAGALACRACRPWPVVLGVSSRLAAAGPTAFPAGNWRGLKSSAQTCFYAHPCPARSRHFLTRGAGREWGGQWAPERAHSTPDSNQPSKVTGIFFPFLHLITFGVLSRGSQLLWLRFEMVLALQRMPSGSRQCYAGVGNLFGCSWFLCRLYRLQVFLRRATIFICVYTRICTESCNKADHTLEYNRCWKDVCLANDEIKSMQQFFTALFCTEIYCASQKSEMRRITNSSSLQSFDPC